jgi:hypothetical protein
MDMFDGNNFNRDFQKMQKRSFSLIGMFMGFGLVSGLVSLALTIGAIAVAIHFIAKFW